MICSMSRKGNCWNNNVVERLFSSLKRKWIGDQLYRSRQQAIYDIRESGIGGYLLQCKTITFNTGISDPG